ncbi:MULTISPECIES: hypothetical protein [Pseudomonas]|uniref:hypothetical protein n=1 Tax=Pseudomonas TaxID=286 RepID=UPI0007D06A6D|nr:hypothetical protein [Pseudomonas fluorescens]
MTHLTDNCTGDAKKNKICSTYTINVISRIALMPGKTIQGCCRELEGEHTIFHYQSKTVAKDEGFFSVGKSCAQSFLKIIKQELPALIDPIQHLSIPTTRTISSNTTTSTSCQTSTPTPAINQELYTAINLFAILQNTIPKYALQRILLTIHNTPHQAVDEKVVWDFIKVLSSFKKPLNELITDAKQKYPNMKTYSFPIINSIASKNWINLP